MQRQAQHYPQQKVLPCIQANHGDRSYRYWIDLALAYYAISGLQFLPKVFKFRLLISSFSTQGIHIWSQNWQKMLLLWSNSTLNVLIAKIADFDDVNFLVACMRLYKLLCWSVCLFVCLSVAEGSEHATYGNRPCCFVKQRMVESVSQSLYSSQQSTMYPLPSNQQVVNATDFSIIFVLK